MLRPAKLFHSFHQLRHYVQTKVTELVVAQHAPPFLLPTTNPTAAATNTLSPWAHQTKPLTNGLTRQMNNKACFSLITGGGCGPLSSWRPAVAPAASAWHRGISLGIHGGYQGLGAFRSYSSSTATPFFKAATSSSHSTVFSHLSSGVFAPMANNMTATKNHTKTTTSPSTCQRSALQQQKDECQCSQAMGASKKYNTEPMTIAPPAAQKSTTTTTATTASIVSDMVPATVKAAPMLCTEDDLIKDMHTTTTVSTTRTCFYITLELAPTSLTTSTSTSTSTSDSSSFLASSETPWTKDVWPMLVKWKERQQDYYDQLLAWLQPCLDQGYRIQWVSEGGGGAALRLYFPKQVTRHDQALAWLEDLKTKNGKTAPPQQDGEDDFLAWVTLEEESILVDEPLVPLGPDYFQGIHLFLTHIDDLVDHGPAFAAAQSCSA
ncbi:hypothetical protein BCR42DRAFT_421013 [Absidia repens]|uniref:Uncharacterized protein n=1 Tax=Absidia repens TaxID=90262 RepID=A0A1X2I9F0_9FUNG|nr:hypothetical protein BCR42DRAFT_421013 [Absidia repens]